MTCDPYPGSRPGCLRAGEKNTPQPYVAAGDTFVYTEILQAQQEPVSARILPKVQEATGLKKDDGKSADKIFENVKSEQMIRTTVMATTPDDGWGILGQAGTMLLKNNPSFNLRNDGHQKLGELAHNQKYLELKKIPSGRGTPSVHIHVRLKNSTTSQNRSPKPY